MGPDHCGLHEVKRHLLLISKAMTKLDSILKRKNITLLTKIHIVKAIVFPVVVYACKCWMVKKVECGRMDAFKLWCWRRLLSVPWTARRSNQSILKKLTLNIHWKDCCWSSNTLATWCEELTHWKIPWCWDRLKVGGEEGDGGKDGFMASPWTWVEQTLGDNKGPGSLACCSPWGHKESDMTERLNDQEPICSGFKVVVLEAATRRQHFFMSGSGSLRRPEP